MGATMGKSGGNLLDSLPSTQVMRPAIGLFENMLNFVIFCFIYELGNVACCHAWFGFSWKNYRLVSP